MVCFNIIIIATCNIALNHGDIYILMSMFVVSIIENINRSYQTQHYTHGGIPEMDGTSKTF